MAETFATLTEAITAVFKTEQISLLSLDRICLTLSNPNWIISSGNNKVVQCSSISRRRVSSILSSSELFVRAGPPRSCMWALRPQNPLFTNDSALSSHIEQVLAENGPLTTQEIVNAGDIAGATDTIIQNFLESHTSDFCINSDGKWWFSQQPYPETNHFDNVINAIVYAFEKLNRESSIEELFWFLSLSVDGKGHKITRRKISRELSRRTDLFVHISRAKYALQNKTNSTKVQIEKSIPTVTNTLIPTPTQTSLTKCEVEFKSDTNCNWNLDPIYNFCETPPSAAIDSFNPQEFFSIGFSGFGETFSFFEA